jgi:predicted TIM-barrel fold metal-dependent hydrolase
VTTLSDRHLDTPQGQEEATLLIDTDVHEYLKSGLDLMPYIDPVWHRFFTNYGWNKKALGTTGGYTQITTKGVAARADWLLPDGTMGSDPEMTRKHLLEGEGVSYAILNGFFHVAAQDVQPEFVSALASAYNDWQIDKWLDVEPRLRGSVHVTLDDPIASAREIDRVAAHPQIVQVFLPTLTNTRYGDPRYRPIFEAAVRNNLVVSFHHGGSTETAIGYPRYIVEWHALAQPQAAQSQLASLIFSGLFDEHPELKVVFMETGVAWLPPFMWRIDQQYRELRSEVPWVKRLPSDHVRDNVRLTTQPMSDIKPSDMVALIEMANIERVYMYSSDYPHYDADSASVLSKHFPEDLKQRIRYRNAVETYPRMRSLAS